MIEEISYLKSEEAIRLHEELMNSFGEIRYGLNSLQMLESALARPQNAAIYENSDIIRQTATLYFGLVKNRIWRGGNKRTATVLIKEFLEGNGFQPTWTLDEIMQLGRNVDVDIWKVDEIEDWLRERAVENRAKEIGATKEDYVKYLIEEDLNSTLSMRVLFAPVREEIGESGMTEDE